MDQQPERVADYRCEIGENPLWHPDEKRIYWLDIPAGRMFRYEPATRRHEECYKGAVVGGFTIQADGALLLFMAGGAVRIWREGEMTTVIDGIPEERGSRFNDVIADPAGRVFCGTMSTQSRAGRLYRLEVDGTLTAVLDGIGTSNGLGFAPGAEQMYYTDSRRREIYLFDYDVRTGAIARQRTFARTREEEGVPDGLTVDAEGFVWSARWGGSCIVRYTPAGIEERRIRFPAFRVSSLTFGGESYTDLYVTTAGGDDRAANGPGAGALFRVSPGIRGVPEFRSRVEL
jgi:D-xylonolactonase